MEGATASVKRVAFNLGANTIVAEKAFFDSRYLINARASFISGILNEEGTIASVGGVADKVDVTKC